MLTMHSFMFISSYEKLRAIIREHASIETMAHAGPALFDVGNPGTLQTSAYVFRREDDPEARQSAEGIYFRLVKEPDSEAKRRRFEEVISHLSMVNGHLSKAPSDKGQVTSDKGQRTSDKGQRTKDKGQIIYHYRQGDFDAIPGSPWVYWITPGLRRVFETFPKLGEIAQPVVGLRSSDNFRFLRYWWEPGVRRIGFGCKSSQEALKTGKRWFPYMKGGSFRRWYGNQEYVVKWERDGAEIAQTILQAYPYLGRPWIGGHKDYFRRGVTWTDLTSGRFSARLSPGGFIFDVKGSSAFPEDIHLVLGLLNSSFAHYGLNLLNPTVSFQVGDLARLPVPTASSEMLRDLVDQAIALAKADSEEDETTWDFIAPPDWPDGIRKVAERHAQLAEIERQIDEEVYRLYGISEEDRRAIEAELSLVNGHSSLDSEDDDEGELTNDQGQTTNDQGQWTSDKLAKAWISYAVGIVMGQFEPGKENGLPAESSAQTSLGRGRFDAATAERLRALKDEDGLLVTDPGHPDDLAAKVLTALEVIFGEAEAETLIRQALGNNGQPLAMLRDYLADKFFKEHIQKYRKRPIYWYLRSARGNYGLWLYYHRLDKDILFKALLNYVEPKIRLEEDRLNTLRARKEKAGRSGREAKQLEKEMDRQEQLISELHDFKDKLRRAADLRLDFDLNDGVILNMAPLWELVPWKEPKRYWEALQEGKYDWAHIALELWPDRVKEKCRTDRSLAIAHGREDLCEAPSPSAAKKTRGGKRRRS